VGLLTGNRDTAGVSERLPETQVLERLGQRILLVHGHRHDETSLGLLGRQEQADIVVVGHTHRPGIETVGGMTVVNPGSHADPRGHHPANAMIANTEDGVRVWLRTVGGADLDSALV
jgi:putative phosphoesterase